MLSITNPPINVGNRNLCAMCFDNHFLDFIVFYMDSLLTALYFTTVKFCYLIIYDMETRYNLGNFISLVTQFLHNLL